MSQHSVTIFDVAKAAGVSSATVSRVLNKNPHVLPALQSRVMEAAQELGYIPNTNAQSLKTHNTHVIGFLVSDISNSYYSSIVRLVEDIVNLEQYNLIICSTGESRTREQAYLEMMQSRKVDALVLNPTCLNTQAVLDISRDIPTLLLNRSIDGPGFRGDIIDTDGYRGCYDLTKELLEHGHRKIYCVHGPMFLPNARDRFHGFIRAMSTCGIEVTEDYPYLFDGQFTFQGGVDAVSHFFRFSDYPSAIISQNNLTTLGILAQLKADGIRVPEDISLVSHDRSDNMELMRVCPTVATFDIQAIAKQVGTSILERIRDPELPNRRYLFEPTIVRGNSVGSPSVSLSQKRDLFSR